MANRIYLDWNASSPLSKSAFNAMKKSFANFGNPSSSHFEGRTARIAIEKARDKIAEILGLKSRFNIIFTSGATESAAMVLHKKKIKCAPIEHDCVKEWSTANINISRNGKVDIEDPLNSTLQVANSETGIIQTIPKGIYFTDAVQGFGKLFIDFSGFDFEFSAISSHKIGGPKGIGAIIAKDIDALDSFMRGGGQEFGKRSGTENLMNIEGFAASIEDKSSEINSGKLDEIKSNRDYLEEMILNESKHTNVVGKDNSRLPNTSFFITPGWKNDHQVAALDLEGFAISSGMACSSGKKNKQNSLAGMGFSEFESNCAIRVSIGGTTTKTELEKFVSVWSSFQKKN
ncbi:MAG: cysteine desulfurase family protein [Paracoccaceae bacterium]